MLELKYKIDRVETLSHTFNIPEDYAEVKDNFNIMGETRIRVDADSDKNYVKVEVTINMDSYEKSTGDKVASLFSLKTLTRFTINDLKQYFSANEELNREVLYHLTEIAVHHTRGMQVVYLLSTPLKSLLLPSIDVKKILSDKLE